MSGDGSVSASGLRGDILFEQQRFPEAEGYFRQSLAEDPNDAAILSKLALCELRQRRKQEALETIQRAISLAPETTRLHVIKAFVEVELRRPKEALASAALALSLDPESDDAFVAQAAAYLGQSEWARAEKSAREALELNPDHAGAANQLAHALRLQNRLPESDQQIAYMLSQNPEDADTHTAAGWTALQRGERQRAEGHFLEALRLRPGSQAARDGLKEAFRAKSPLYRAYLNYCFFMRRFTGGKQWLIILGLLAVVHLAPTILGSYSWIVILAYLTLVFWIHVARPIGNLQLALDRFARHALDRGEKIEAWVSGGGVLAGILLALLGMLPRLSALVLPGLVLIAAAVPFAHVFTNATPGKWVFGSLGTMVLVCGGFAVAQPASGDPANSSFGVAVYLAMFCVIVTTWLCNVSALNRR